MESTLVLTGPTGSGKTELGIVLAERLGAEIVAMDSMTLYRGMDIGTAKPTVQERQRVPHHLIDVLEPSESASVAWWLECAAACCRDIQARGKRVLFVGGTPLYLKALLRGLFDGPPANIELRQRLEQEAQTIGPQALHDRLALVDPLTAARLHPNDQRRVIRALEVWELTGRPISDWQKQWAAGSGQWAEGSPKHPEACGRSDALSSLPTASCPLSTVLWVDRPRAELYARIDARVERMFAEGFVEEVRALRRRPLPFSKEASQALGYKEVLAHLDGQATLEDTIRQIQTRTRNFAKRQITWFRHIPECQPASEELTFKLWAS
jgi:tRNA dimethylallyltransferase